MTTNSQTGSGSTGTAKLSDYEYFLFNGTEKRTNSAGKKEERIVRQHRFTLNSGRRGEAGGRGGREGAVTGASDEIIKYNAFVYTKKEALDDLRNMLQVARAV